MDFLTVKLAGLTMKKMSKDISKRPIVPHDVAIPITPELDISIRGRSFFTKIESLSRGDVYHLRRLKLDGDGILSVYDEIHQDGWIVNIVYRSDKAA